MNTDTEIRPKLSMLTKVAAERLETIKKLEVTNKQLETFLAHAEAENKRHRDKPIKPNWYFWAPFFVGALLGVFFTIMLFRQFSVH